MPLLSALLQPEGAHFWRPTAYGGIRCGLGHALFAEFLGTLLFQFLGGLSGTAVGNGLALAVTAYLTGNISGGLLNPAIPFAHALSGHMHWITALLYTAVEIAGALAGAAIQLRLLPGSRTLGLCPGLGKLSAGQVWGWEIVLTFLLVGVYYSIGVAEPNFGPVGPLAMGLTVFAAVEAGGKVHGVSINPARLLGPAALCRCKARTVWLFLSAQLAGAALAAALYAAPFLGLGQFAPRGLQGAAPQPESSDPERAVLLEQ